MGLPLVGENVAFVRDPVAFVSARATQHGPVFRTNVLGGATAIAASHRAALDVLHSTDAEAGDAYAEFLGPLYPAPNVLLLRNADPMRGSLVAKFGAALSEDAVDGYRPAIEMAARAAIAHVAERPGRRIDVKLYDTFKHASERVMLDLLVGVLDEKARDDARKSARAHFRALVAAPVHVELFGRRSARAEATRARKHLITRATSAVETECTRLKNASDDALAATPLEALVRGIGGSKATKGDRSLLVDHLVLLLSEAVPKSIASGLVSLFAALSGPDASNADVGGMSIEPALMEALRMWPPLIGGLRVTGDGPVEIAGVQVPPGHRLWYSALQANRDPASYRDPDSFRPERWADKLAESKPSRCPFAHLANAPAENMEEPPMPVTFGAGDRACPGRFLAWEILLALARALLEVGEVLPRDAGGKEPELRYLPVCRPVDEVVVQLRRR